MQLLVLYILVPLFVVLVHLLSPKLAEWMSREILPALVGDILALIINVLKIISNVLQKAFSGMSQISLPKEEFIGAFGQLTLNPLREVHNVYIGTLCAFLGVLSGTVQAWYITLCVMLGENLTRILKPLNKMKLILIVMGMFVGCIVWEMYGGQFGNITLMFAGILFLALLNITLLLVFNGMNLIKASLSVFIGMLCTALSGCYLSVLENLFLFGTQSLTQCFISTGVILILLFLLTSCRSSFFD